MLEKITEKSLGNGLKIICLKKTDTPIVTVHVWYKVGSVNERDGIRGISHVLEHMMFRGSKNVKSEEHARRINDVGGHCNAFTTEDVTAYTNSVPREHFEMVLDLEADRMQFLAIEKELLETERKVVIEEYHNYMNNPVAKAFLEFRSIFFSGHSYQVSPLGILDNLNTMTIENLRDYYSACYSPDNAVMVVVGDIASTDFVFDAVEKRFGSIQRADRNQFVQPPQLQQVNGSNWMKRRVDFDVPIILVGYPAPASASNHALPLDILQTIVSQGETSRIYREMVRKNPIAVMAGGVNNLLKHGGISLFFALFTPDVNYKKVEKALNNQIDQIKKGDISEEEMNKVKNAALTQRTFELFSVDQIALRLGYSETIDGDYTVWVKKLEALEKLHRDTLHEVAELYWKNENRHTLFLKPKKTKLTFYILGIIKRLLSKGK